MRHFRVQLVTFDCHHISQGSSVIWTVSGRAIFDSRALESFSKWIRPTSITPATNSWRLVGKWHLFAMASSLGTFDLGLGNIPQAAFSSLAMDGDEYVRCAKCGFGGCDVRVSGCGCTVHAVSGSSGKIRRVLSST